MWPTLSDCKAQCNIDDDNSFDDGVLVTYLFAAKNHIAVTLNRKIVATTSGIINDTDLALDTGAGDSLRLACLLIIGHWYLNRESTSTLTVKEVPMSFNALLQPYRVY